MSKDNGQQKAKPRNDAKRNAKEQRTAKRKAMNVAKNEARRQANLAKMQELGLELGSLQRFKKRVPIIDGRPATYTGKVRMPVEGKHAFRKESPSEALARHRREIRQLNELGDKNLEA